MFTLTLSSYFGSPGGSLIAHQRCHQLTAVKTGYPLTSITWPYRGLRCRPIKVEYFWSYPLTIYLFTNDCRLTFTFFKFISNMLCLCQYRPALLRFWFQTDLGSKNSASFFFFNTGGEDHFLPWSRVGHAPRPIFMLWLVKIWQVSSCVKFMQHLESCLLRSWSWQSFESTCDVFNCLFPLDIQNEIKLLSRVFSYSWLTCLLGFSLRNASLVKADNPISDGIVFVFHFAGCVREL